VPDWYLAPETRYRRLERFLGGSWSESVPAFPRTTRQVSGGRNSAACYRPTNGTASPPWRLNPRSRASGCDGWCLNPCFLRFGLKP